MNATNHSPQTSSSISCLHFQEQKPDGLMWVSSVERLLQKRREYVGILVICGWEMDVAVDDQAVPAWTAMPDGSPTGEQNS